MAGTGHCKGLHRTGCAHIALHVNRTRAAHQTQSRIAGCIINRAGERHRITGSASGGYHRRRRPGIQIHRSGERYIIPGARVGRAVQINIRPGDRYRFIRSYICQVHLTGAGHCKGLHRTGCAHIALHVNRTRAAHQTQSRIAGCIINRAGERHRITGSASGGYHRRRRPGIQIHRSGERYIIPGARVGRAVQINIRPGDRYRFIRSYICQVHLTGAGHCKGLHRTGCAHIALHINCTRAADQTQSRIAGCIINRAGERNRITGSASGGYHRRCRPGVQIHCSGERYIIARARVGRAVQIDIRSRNSYCAAGTNIV